MDIRPASDHSFLITTGNEISERVHEDTLRVMCALRDVPGITNVHPAYASVLVDFDLRRISPGEMESALHECIGAAAHAPLPPARHVEIPVRYGGADGPDLEDVAAHTGLPAHEVVARHAAGQYLVYFLGFSPGFPYLGGMPPELASPRLSAPRHTVPAGSVAIGGAQTGIYPVASPGGWRIIGRTELELFRPGEDPPVLLRMGDRVRFMPSERSRY